MKRLIYDQTLDVKEAIESTLSEFNRVYTDIRSQKLTRKKIRLLKIRLNLMRNTMDFKKWTWPKGGK